MHYLEFIIVSAIIFPIVGQASGAGECRTRKLYCFDCDSRHDPYCSDPFNMTLPPENKPASRVCHGCCVKIIHKYQDGDSEVYCYDCDSRYDPYCADPFNKTLPPENKPATRSCKGCCIKFLHRFTNPAGGIEEYVQRSCTENIIINYFMVDHVCMGEGKGRGKMCFCEDNYCNDGKSLQASTTTVVTVLLVAVLTIRVLTSLDIGPEIVNYLRRRN